MLTARSMRARLAPAAALVSLGLATAAHAAPANRLYIKQNGNIAFAIDPGGLVTSGQLFTRGAEQYGVTTADTGLQFRRSGEPFMSIRQASSTDPHQFGTMVIGGGYVYDGLAVPFQSSGTLVFFHTPPGTSQKVGMVEIDHTDGSVDLSGAYHRRFAYRRESGLLKNRARQLLTDAYACLRTKNYPPLTPDMTPQPLDPHTVGGVSYWDKQVQIHYGFAEHTMDDTNPAFLPWHREFVNRLEDQLRGCDPLVSLAYWDFTRSPMAGDSQDGIPLMTSSTTYGWFGNGHGQVGGPFPWDNNGTFRGTRAQTGNPNYLPQMLSRTVRDPWLGTVSDDVVLQSADYQALCDALEGAHNSGHLNLGKPAHDFNGDVDVSASGFDDNIWDIDRSPEDPVFFLLHANVDRLWATWQRDPAHPERLAAATVYGDYYTSDWPNEWRNHVMGRDVIDPWAGGNGHMNNMSTPLRPWTAPDNQQVSKSYLDLTVIIPRLYEAPDGTTTY
jgi:hypothetical protein